MNKEQSGDLSVDSIRVKNMLNSTIFRRVTLML